MLKVMMHLRRVPSTILVALLLALTVLGCRTAREVVVAPPDIPLREDFDPSLYPDPPPVLDGDIVHVLPPQILGNSSLPPTTRPSVPRTVSGYRIQVGSHSDRNESNIALQEAIEWWNAYSAEADVDATPVYIEWEQPYWKIRVGNFRTRQEASRFLAEVRKTFVGAFVVPSAIEVR